MFAPREDWEEQKARFAVDDRLRLPGALPEALAEDIHSLLSHASFATMLARNGQGVALGEGDISSMTPEQRTQLIRDVYKDAGQGSGFLYDGHQLAGSSDPAMQGILARINAPETLERVRELTGITDITHADGQATRYRGGHFLTRHKDDPGGQQRRLAYVLSLTKNWHPDWGGLLQFFENDGRPRDAWAPGWNILSMFNVRHIHSVTYVTPFAGADRLSVTGWFRAGEPS